MRTRSPRRPFTLSARARRALGAIAAATMAVTAWPTVGTASAATTFVPRLNCQPETFPAAHAPRSASPVPYRVPFEATLTGGQLAVRSPTGLAGVTFGAPSAGHPTGALFGEACGLVGLPSLAGGSQGNPFGAPGNPGYNNNFILHGPPSCPPRLTPGPCANDTRPVPVSITLGGTGVSLIDGYGSADGTIAAQILPTPAANGGLNINLQATAKATAVINPAQILSLLTGPGITLPPALQGLIAGLAGGVAPSTGGVCTLAVGDLRTTGLPANQVGANTSSVPMTTMTSTNPPSKGLPSVTVRGRPVTGPPTNGTALTVSDNFPVPAISPQMPPSPNLLPPTTSAPNTLCTPMVAQLFNVFLGLPAAPGSGVFTAPFTFAVNVTS